ncbi:DUF4817 domain-containing protein [Trichonephila clavipes]|nr:DUF4817 domain-containing protein [Trichonephila clavipes]
MKDEYMVTFGRLQCPIWAFWSTCTSNLTSIGGKCSTNEPTLQRCQTLMSLEIDSPRVEELRHINSVALINLKLVWCGSLDKKLTAWCTLWAGGIIGPYFFKNDEGYNVTVNGDRYRAMITNFFIPELNNHDVQELWFQQDGATCHTARATIDLLKDTFGDRLISRFGPVNWPPRSCDLTPLDYFLWGYVKSLVYADKPQTLDHLEDNIRRVIADIRPQMLEKVIENWTSRLDYIRVSRGSPMPENIFKM